MRTPAYLSNPVHAALTGGDAPFAVSHGLALRFEHGTIPFAAVPQPETDALADLVPLLTPGEEIYLTADPGQTIPAVSGLEILSSLPGLQMRFIAPVPTEDADAEIVVLRSEHTGEMLDLKARAFPGFFGPRAPELGRFFGIRDPGTGRLVAMGGERLATGAEREVSAVCTDPAFAGRGYAARIVCAVLRHQAQLGTGSILHVTAANTRAIALYTRLGFIPTGTIDFVKLRRA